MIAAARSSTHDVSCDKIGGILRFEDRIAGINQKNRPENGGEWVVGEKDR